MSIQHQFHSLFYHKKLERKYMYSRVKRNQMNKVNKYSIRKSSFGAVSVAVAALMVFGTYSGVSADEQKVDSHRTEKEEQKVSEKPDDTKQKNSEEKLAELPSNLQAPVLEKEEFIHHFMILKCGLENQNTLDSSAILGQKKTKYNIEYLVKRDAIHEIPDEYIEDEITIDKIMILYGREK